MLAFVPEIFVKTRPVVKIFVVVTLVMFAFVAAKLVEVMPPETLTFVPVIEERLAFVDVMFVKMPVLGVTAPIGVLLIVPPLIVTASTNMPSVMLFAGKVITPVALKLVVVREVNTPFVNELFAAAKFVVKKLVVVSDPPTEVVKARPVEKKLVDDAETKTAFVEVKLVNTPVLGVMAPIEVPLIVPPEIVSPSTTIASVTDPVGKFRAPMTPRFVVVTPTKVELVKLVLVVNAIAPPLITIAEVPVTEVPVK